MSKKKPYLPNNWKAYKEAPAECFESIPFDEFMEWRIGGYEIPSSVACIIRETDNETGKVKEHVYQLESAARKKANKIMDKGNPFIVCTSDAVHQLTHEEIPEYDDPLA